MLYNRYLLRRTAIEMSKSKWSAKDLDPLRHYGLTMRGAYFEVWFIQPTVSDETQWQWAGCTMERISDGYCTTDPELRALIDWINWIHYWCLQFHAVACQDYVKRCMKTREDKSGYRPSDVDGTPLEDVAVPKEGFEGMSISRWLGEDWTGKYCFSLDSRALCVLTLGFTSTAIATRW